MASSSGAKPTDFVAQANPSYSSQSFNPGQTTTPSAFYSPSFNGGSIQPSVTVQPYGYGGFGPNSHSQAAVLGVPAQAAMPFMHPSAGRGGGFTSQHNSHLMPQSQYGGTGAQGFMPGLVQVMGLRLVAVALLHLLML